MNSVATHTIKSFRLPALSATRLLALLAATAASVLLAGCGAGSAQTAANPQADPTAASDKAYTGPAPASADVEAFMINLWNNISTPDRCGACHVQGNQSPMFARSDDINLAYQAAQTVANLANPAASTMVAKVGSGHHCWLASNQACADTMTTWIQNWAGVTLGNSTAQLKLVAPQIISAGGSRSFPADPTIFSQTVYPLLAQYCSRCHSPNALVPQSPYFAQPDVAAAYLAAQPEINLDTPAQSTFYIRLADQFHNCWNGNCPVASAAMLSAIQAFANQVPVTQVNPNYVLSKALSLYDGIVSSGGPRVETGLIAKYEFKTGTGTIAYDSSGVEPELDLNMTGNVTWVGGWGVQIENGAKLQGTTTGSVKIQQMIAASGEFSIEAWVAPDSITETGAYIVSYSGGDTARNVTLGQTQANYDFALRSTTTGANGTPLFSTPTANTVVQASLQHVVLTYDPVNGRQIYVNGVLAATGDPQKGGSLSEWDNTFALVLGNEVSSDKPWSGELRMVALYNHAMTATEVQTNFAAGIGERYMLLFNVDQYTGMSQTYVMFEVSQYDSSSYLFNKPVFLSLDPNTHYSGLVLKGMRIAENGSDLLEGQAYATLNTTVTGQGFNPATQAQTGVSLSSVGTTVMLDKGPAYDQFFLTFDQLGSATNVYVDPVPTAPAPNYVAAPSDIGVRTFEQINATLSVMTTVPVTTPEVATLYQTLQQSLPAVPSFQSFVASDQMAVAQLSIAYCDALVSNQSLASAYFPGFNFSAPPATAFSGNGLNAMLTPLINNMLVANTATSQFLATAPSAASVTTEITNLVGLLQPSVSQDATGTANIVKASCAAVAGSAAMLVI
jgi:hypothetical protein